MTRETSKSELEVKRYFVGFWLHYRRIFDWKKIIDKIEKGEKKILRLRQIRDAIGMKVERHLDNCFAHEGYTLNEEGKKLTSVNLIHNFWPTMKIVYAPGTKNQSYTEEEDSFLLAMMHRHGYGATERIRLEIRRAWQFRFDWFFKSRNNLEIQKRCDQIVKSIEKQMEDITRAEDREFKFKAEARIIDPNHDGVCLNEQAQISIGHCDCLTPRDIEKNTTHERGYGTEQSQV